MRDSGTISSFPLGFERRHPPMHSQLFRHPFDCRTRDILIKSPLLQHVSRLSLLIIVPWPLASCTRLVPILEPRRRHEQFQVRKGGIFRPGAYSLAPRHFRIAQRRTERCEEIEGLRGGVPMYRLAERRDPACATAEGSGQIGGRSHRPRAKKDPFRTETNSAGASHTPCRTLPKTDDRNSFVQP